MALATKTNKIAVAVSYIPNEKLSNRDFMVSIQPTPIIGFGLITKFAPAFRSQPSLPSHTPPLPIIRRLSALPIRMRLTSNMLANPFTPTYTRTEIAPVTVTLPSNRRCSFELYPAIIAMERLTISLFTKLQKIKDVHIYRCFGAVKMLGYLCGCHLRIIGNDIGFFFISPAKPFKPLPLARTFYRAILSVMGRFRLELTTTLQTLCSYHNLIIPQNFIRYKFPDVEQIKSEDVLVFKKSDIELSK